MYSYYCSPENKAAHKAALRDDLAKEAMIKLIEIYANDSKMTFEKTAWCAYSLANAMLEEREKKPNEK